MALQELCQNSFVFGICGDHVTAPKNRLAHIACRQMITVALTLRMAKPAPTIRPRFF